MFRKSINEKLIFEQTFKRQWVMWIFWVTVFLEEKIAYHLCESPEAEVCG